MNTSIDFDLHHAIVVEDVTAALNEDMGCPPQDWSAALIAETTRTGARILLREPAVLCGQPWANEALRQIAPSASAHWQVAEGARLAADTIVVELEGAARELLSAERTMLNFLQTLSAVATKTADYVAAIADVPQLRARIVDTRKTLPGLRVAQKYAVVVGGGVNHRMGLYDAILIKENHIKAAGGVPQVLARAHALAPSSIKFIEIEVESLAQLQEALEGGARMVLLDNMPAAMLQQAVALNAGRAVLEISGGVNLATVRELATTGVDRISIGALTKDVKAIDFSMRFDYAFASTSSGKK